MKHFAVIGNPIEHSLSPVLHNWVFKSLNIQAEYRKIRLDEKNLSDIVKEIKNDELDGFNVTIPYKENIMKFLDEINARAESIASVNCIIKSKTKIIGNNTDWYGFSIAMKINKIDVSGKEVIVLGAGGTGKSILYSLKQLGAKKIILLNRTLKKAKELQDQIIIPYSLINTESVIKNDSIILNLEYPKNDDPRDSLFKYAVDSKWIIMEMSPQSANLESIFRNLTTEKTKNA